MDLKQTIYTRKSCRKYQDRTVDGALMQQILEAISELKPLYPQIKVSARLVSNDQVRFYFPWKAPHLVAIFSEVTEGYLENVGFLFQQLDLFLQSRGLGSCWMGLGKPKAGSELAQPREDGLEFVIFLPFGYPDGECRRTSVQEFQRKAMNEITDSADPKLECVRLAPSSTNSQPWYFTHTGDTLHAFCSRKGILKHAMLGTMNRIDMGIALAHLYVENRDSFRFFRDETVTAPEGFDYIGSVII